MTIKDQVGYLADALFFIGRVLGGAFFIFGLIALVYLAAALGGVQ